ncbi:hypothetical protein [Micromonospora purpureochromogenes]|uniref:40-residue YVTN family beta-propeller repeat-containing protein n=1 Tax=Micromonospora purpureochromogenes TaxID=47872 RepID=A0ABX2RN18_9ACTN|nr:hypothetical protein [Micromonospora purpureochromogenes]NYF56559.1 hypothetical protein [Micromonospora purpureochromogenes]
MRFRRVARSALASTLIAATGLVAAVAPARAADTSTVLQGVKFVKDIAAANGRLFISASNQIVVTDESGTTVGAVTGLAEPHGLAVTPDGSRLYAALNASNEIVEIDTTALTVTRRFDLTAYPYPAYVSLAGNRLWVGHGPTNSWSGGVVGLDLSAATPEPVRIASGLYGPPKIAAGGSTVVAGNNGSSPADLFVYDVSTTPATLRGVLDGHDNNFMYLKDITITADGSRAITAFDSPYRYDIWDTASMTRVGAYGEEPTFVGYPNAVALSADGTRVIGTRSSRDRIELAGPRIGVYDAATTTKLHNADNPAGQVVEGALTFSGTDAFTVLFDMSTGRYTLWRLRGATLAPSSVAVTAPGTGTALVPLTVTGRLTLSDGSAPGAQPLVVTRRHPDGTGAALAPVTTAADGTFSLTDTPPVGGTVGYEVLWDGNSAFRWNQGTATVEVARQPATVSLTGPTTANLARNLRFSGTLTTPGRALTPGTSLTVYRTLNGDETTMVILPAVFPASDGTFRFTDTPGAPGSYTYTARWDGDATFLPARADHIVVVK